MIFIPSHAPALFPGLGGRMPSIGVFVNTNLFFDRPAVIAALGRLRHAGLSRGSLLVRRTAQRSIRKVGLARRPLKLMRDNPGVPMAVLLRTPGLRQQTRSNLVVRMWEIDNRPPSRPGNPPHTHVPNSHMLGFRRNLYNAMDPSMRSAVVGPRARGPDPLLPNLHEFGGTRTLVHHYYEPSSRQVAVWHRRKLTYVSMLARWTSAHERPGGRWRQSGFTMPATYPERPFMGPALQRCLPQLARMFNGQFSAFRRNA